MILSEIFRRLSIKRGVFVEFGAWDGMYLSNCRYLYEKGWRGTFIEGNIKRYRRLCANYANAEDIIKIHSFVGAPKYGLAGITLAQLLKANGVPPDEVVFVSIDVDGPDLEIFCDLELSPPVILMEGGFSFSPYLAQSIPVEIAWKNVQQPLAVITKTARER